MAANSYNRRINLYINGKEVKNEIGSIKAEMSKLINAQAQMTIGSKEYNQASKQIRNLKGIIHEHNEGLKATGKSWNTISGMANKINKYFGMATAFIATATGAVFGAKKIIESNAELSDSFSNVSKTTGLTTEEVQELYKELKKIDTRTANKDLLELATIAGKLGVTGKENVLGFVRAADQINVALSEDLGGNAEEAIKQVGKLVDIFKIDDTFGLEGGMLKVGSAINALGSASTASEGYLVEFAKRVAGIAPAAGISLEKVLGLAATLDQLGQTSEVSSTVFSQVIPLMFKDTATFADIANMSVEDFTALLKKDTNEAFIKFLEGLNGNNEGLATMVQKMDELGLEGKRSVSVLGVLANNTGLLREQQLMANDEFAKGTSLTEEFEKKNTNLAATLEKLKKRLAEKFINSELVNGLTAFVSWIDRATESKVSDQIREEQHEFNNLIMSLQGTNKETEQRSRLIKEIQSKYGNYIGNIDLEKASYRELALLLAEANKQFEKKIRLAVIEEELKDNQALAVKLDRERYYLQRLLNQESIKYFGEQATQWDNEKKSFELQMKKKEIDKQVLARGMDEVGITSAEMTAFHYTKTADTKLTKLDKQINDLKEEYTSLIEERQDNTDPFVDSGGKIDIADDEDKDNNSGGEDKVVEKRKALLEKLKDLQENYRLSLLEKDAQEIESIKEKYAKLIEEASGYKDIQEDLLEQQGLEIAAKEKEQEDRRREEKEKEERAYQERIIEIKKEYGLYSDEELMQQELNNLITLREQKLLTEEEFLILKDQLEDKYRKTSEEKDKEAEEKKREQKLNMIADFKFVEESFTNFVGSLQDLQLAETERRIAKGVITEEQGEKEKKEILKKYADMQFVAKIAQIGADTAAGMMRAYADLPLPLAILADIFIGATSLAQLQIANKERQRVKQLARGKYNVIGDSDGYLYPNVPFVGPVMHSGIIHGPTLISESGDEIVLTGNHVKNLQANFPDILSALHATRVPQRAGGVYVNENNVSSLNTNNSELIKLMRANYQVLNTLAKNGVVSVYDQRKIKEMRDSISEQERIEAASYR